MVTLSLSLTGKIMPHGEALNLATGICKKQMQERKALIRIEVVAQSHYQTLS